MFNIYIDNCPLINNRKIFSDQVEMHEVEEINPGMRTTPYFQMGKIRLSKIEKSSWTNIFQALIFPYLPASSCIHYSI